MAMAPPRRRPFLPFILLLPISLLLVLFLSSQSSTSLPNPNRNPEPDPRNFSLLIKLLAYDRLGPLRRCLLSLAAADYSGDRVTLHVLLDHFPLAANSTVDKKLENSRQILDFLDKFRWPHGEKRIHYRAANAGLQAQWLEAWWPSSDDEFAFVVEDDLEVSPLYYRFLKGLVLRYYYDRSNYSPYVFGASLQRPRFVAGLQQRLD